MVLLFTLALAALPAERAIIIGDSQAAGLRNAGVLTTLGVEIHAFAGKPSAFFVQWLHKHPRVLAGKSLVFFQLGGNDVTAGESLETIKLNVLLLAAITKAANPDARIVFGAVPVRGAWFDAQKRRRPDETASKERTFEQLNAWLQTGEHPDFSMLALNPILTDPSAPRFVREEYRRPGSPDVHLNRRGYVALSTAVASLVLE
jgi:lysophospholipase L1-like esterase